MGVGQVWNGFTEQVNGQSRKVDVTDDELAQQEAATTKEADVSLAPQQPESNMADLAAKAEDKAEAKARSKKAK